MPPVGMRIHRGAAEKTENNAERKKLKMSSPRILGALRGSAVRADAPLPQVQYLLDRAALVLNFLLQQH
jgi:hypothetical protein